jgi:hypothetical protein
MLKRGFANLPTLDQGALAAVEHNPYAGGTKTLPVGPEFQKVPAQATIHGQDYSAGKTVSPGTVVYFFNSDSGTQWVTFSLATIGSAPSSIATGIPLIAGAWTILSVGENTNVRTSSATVGCYPVRDTSTAQII